LQFLVIHVNEHIHPAWAGAVADDDAGTRTEISWRNAQADVEKAIGSKSIAELNALLDLSAGRLRSAG
jgi:hypothetical protein